ncbi:MAG TPA: heparan-alpha-glucosaminide N-acetyltransferase domain-containing protein [Candidatus Didemnitutus sp.]|nr:heparan-alpha-glucosaminide N-acetyltransferase domain-containing protein [Candidatus Didemnitutus sp.]
MNPTAAPTPAARLDSVDLVRGIIMVLMALDHVRDYFHFSALHGFDPLDLQKTSVAIFFTRWITHYCAPIFCFLAGTGAFLSVSRGKSKRELSWFLFSRGLWLIFLELTLVDWFGWSWVIQIHDFNLLVLWSLGCSMIVLSALIHLPVAAVATFGLTLILFHNATDGIKAESWGSFGWLWHVLHVPGNLKPAPGYGVFVLYPLIPWVGVMAAGYGFGAFLVREPATRTRRLFILGASLTVAFVLLRFSNLYGNPRPWTEQSRPMFTLLSFLDCAKYPPSLCYLLMTLGPAILLLAIFDRGVPALLKPFLVFGRVPMFYYLLHIPLLHLIAFISLTIQVGRADFFFGNAGAPPPNAGFSLITTYLAWLLVVVILYPLCRWFADLKKRRRDTWLSYF